MVCSCLRDSSSENDVFRFTIAIIRDNRSSSLLNAFVIDTCEEKGASVTSQIRE